MYHNNVIRYMEKTAQERGVKMLASVAESDLEKEAMIGAILKGLKWAAPKLENIGTKTTNLFNKGTNFMKNKFNSFGKNLNNTVNASYLIPQGNKNFQSIYQNSANKMKGWWNNTKTEFNKNFQNTNWKKVGIGAGVTTAGAYGTYKLTKSLFGGNDSNQQSNPYMQPQQPYLNPNANMGRP